MKTKANMNMLACAIKADIAALAGDELPYPSDESWQDVAGTLACNLRVFADALDEQRQGRMIFNGDKPTDLVFRLREKATPQPPQSSHGPPQSR